MDKKEWLIEVKIKTYNGGEAMKRMNDKWSETISRMTRNEANIRLDDVNWREKMSVWRTDGQTDALKEDERTCKFRRLFTIDQR